MNDSFAKLPCETVTVGADSGDGGLDVVLLHGYAMRPTDLSPFASALNITGRYLFPQAPHSVSPAGYGWWPIDEERRSRSLAAGPRDLAEEDPPGRIAARNALQAFLVQHRAATRTLVLGGFSQGGMLALDYLLHGTDDIAALVLLSSSRIALTDWQHLRGRLRDLPVFVSHGQDDADLAFEAGERLYSFVSDAGARAVWCPFDGGHETPLKVWRELRKFLNATQFKYSAPA
jgi:phospholipase/carboxylesterase